MSNLRLRVISALVLAAIVLCLTWLGGIPFRVLAAAVGLAILFEWTTMAGLRRDRMAAVALFALAGIVFVAMVAGFPASTQLLLLAAAVLAGIVLDLRARDGWWRAGGILYAGLPAIALSHLRGGDGDGLVAILFLFAVVWATDIFAYFVGRAIGGPKLAPAISPGKTWSGAVGGALCAVAAGLAVAISARWAAGPALIAAILVLSAISQAGDLFESWVKRRFGAKDSSSLIPGHGGVMDRVDGLVAAAVALYVMGWMLGGAGMPVGALRP